MLQMPFKAESAWEIECRLIVRRFGQATKRTNPFEDCAKLLLAQDKRIIVKDGKPHTRIEEKSFCLAIDFAFKQR